jgi:TetR/AcrR family transcriptional regulator, transcriptional repressor of bet genes
MVSPANTARGTDRREELLDATCTLIAQSGTRTLRIEDVARQAGVSIGLVYYYFKGRNQLVAEAFEHANRRVEDAFAARETGTGTGLERLVDRLLREIADDALATESWMIWAELTSGASENPGLRQLLDTAYDYWTSEIGKLLVIGQKDGSIPTTIDVADSAVRLTASVEGLGARWMLGSLGEDRARDLALGAVERELGVTLPRP